MLSYGPYYGVEFGGVQVEDCAVVTNEVTKSTEEKWSFRFAEPDLYEYRREEAEGKIVY